MKRILAAVMAIVLCLSFCACGKAYSIGDTVEVENFTYKITDVQIADGVKLNEDFTEDFLTIAGEGDEQFTAPGGSKLLWFSAEYTYTGAETEDSDMAKDLFVPIVKYKSNRFDTNYIILTKAPDGKWYNLKSDLSWETRQESGLDMNSLSFDLDPQDTIEVRGFIYISAEAAEAGLSKINFYMDTAKFDLG